MAFVVGFIVGVLVTVFVLKDNPDKKNKAKSK